MDLTLLPVMDLALNTIFIRVCLGMGVYALVWAHVYRCTGVPTVCIYIVAETIRPSMWPMYHYIRRYMIAYYSDCGGIIPLGLGMCLCGNSYVYTHMYTQLYAHVHTCTHHIYIYVNIFTGRDPYTHISMRMCPINIYIYTHTYIYI